MTDDTAAQDPPLHLRRHLLAEGWTDADIRRTVRAGAWVRIRNGAFVETAAWERSWRARRHRLLARAVVAQARTAAVVSHMSGAPFYDAPVWGLDLRSVHITRPDGRAGRAEVGVRQHRGALLEGDVREVHGLLVISPARLVAETASLSATAPTLVLANHLMHAGLLAPEELHARNEQGLVHWAGTLNMNVVCRLADPLIESVGESRVLYHCYVAGLPKPELQVEVHDEGRLLGRLDFLFRKHGVWVEFDGKEKYLKYRLPGESLVDAVLREKRREDAIRRATGYRCFRITWADLARPEVLMARLRAFLTDSSGIAA